MKIGDHVEVTVNGSRFPGIITTYKYSKLLAENSSTLFLGPNLQDFVKLSGFFFVLMPNIYAASVKEEFCSDPKYIGSWIVLPIHENSIELKPTDLSSKIYKEFFTD